MVDFFEAPSSSLEIQKELFLILFYKNVRLRIHYEDHDQSHHFLSLRAFVYRPGLVLFL